MLRISSFLIHVCIVLALVFSGSVAAASDSIVVSSIEYEYEVDSDSFDESFDIDRNLELENYSWFSPFYSKLAHSFESVCFSPAALGHLRAPPSIQL